MYVTLLHMSSQSIAVPDIRAIIDEDISNIFTASFLTETYIIEKKLDKNKNIKKDEELEFFSCKNKK